MQGIKFCKHGFYTCSFIGQVTFCNECPEGENYQMKKETRGGSRPGSGRPKKPPTITISFRILPEWEETIKQVVRKTIAKLKTA